MALLQTHYLSKVMERIVTFHMYLPNDTNPEILKGNPHYKRETKTLYLLHGYSGNTTDWITGSNAMEISRKYNIAIVMPSGENSFYINRPGTGNAYETFIVEELNSYVSRTFGLSNKPQDVIIGGLSMGGFGAMRLAIKYNHTYGVAFGLSSALIIDDLKNRTKENIDEMPVKLADYYYYRSIFGDLSKLDESETNPEYLVKQKVERNEKIPPIFMACGTEDTLLKQNRKFKEFLSDKGVDVVYKESKGIHDWTFWNEYLETAVLWAIDKCDA